MDFNNPEAVWALLTQIGVMLVIFLFNLLVLRALVFKPTLKILFERRKRFEGLNAESKALQERVALQLAKYEGLMEEARHMARKAREEILLSAEKERQAVLNDARQTIEKQLASARADLVREVEKARQDLQKTSADLAGQIVAKVLNKKAA